MNEIMLFNRKLILGILASAIMLMIYSEINRRRSWFRNAKRILRNLKLTNELTDMYLRKVVLEDDDWYRGHESFLLDLHKKYELIEAESLLPKIKAPGDESELVAPRELPREMAS